MTPWDWAAEDLDVTVREIVKAFLLAPFLLAGFCAICFFLWMLVPAS